MKKITLVTLALLSSITLLSQDLLETEKWKAFFEEKPYEQRALAIDDETFWDVDQKFTYHISYPLFLIYEDQSSVEIQWTYEGLNNLLYKKHTLVDENFERYEKANIAYMVFDTLLLKNPMVGNAIDGDFMIVYKRGPMSIYREYYTSPIERGNIQSAFAIYHLSEKEDNFQLGAFEKKASKIVGDCEELAQKIKDKIIGYRNEEDDIIRIAVEYNEWVKANYPYRYEDHTWMFWQSRF